MAINDDVNSMNSSIAGKVSFLFVKNNKRLGTVESISMLCTLPLSQAQQCVSQVRSTSSGVFLVHNPT